MHAPTRKLRQSIRESGIYQRARASWIYDLYWHLANRRIIEDREQETQFYRNLLTGFKNGDLIFDIGANQGYKADIFVRIGARVVCIEPDESSQRLLRQRFVNYRLQKKPVVILPKAVSDRNSVELFWIDAPASGKNTLSRKWVDTLRNDAGRFGEKLTFGSCREVETVTIEELISEFGEPFYIKIDVEGHELNVLKGMRNPVPYLSFEVNLPEFLPEGLECVALLGALAKEGRFNYAADCRDGLVLSEWCAPEEFSRVLSQCGERSVEVAWRTNCPIG